LGWVFHRRQRATWIHRGFLNRGKRGLVPKLGVGRGFGFQDWVF
jgi:hypothetical protein